jgi:diguanylate cyclase (GGDEF)-like protein
MPDTLTDEQMNQMADGPATAQAMPETLTDEQINKMSSAMPDTLTDDEMNKLIAPKPSVPAPVAPAPQPSIFDKAKQFGQDVVQGAQYLAAQPPNIPQQIPTAQQPAITPAKPNPDWVSNPNDTTGFGKLKNVGLNRPPEKYLKQDIKQDSLDNYYTENGSPGMIEPGNIDLKIRPTVFNQDGSISTVRSKSFNIDGKEVLLPTVSDDGKILTDQEAVDLYRKTGQHLGIFKDVASADAAAQKIHEEQSKQYPAPSPSAPASTTEQLPLPKIVTPTQTAKPLGQPGSLGLTGETKETALMPAPESVSGPPSSELGAAPASTTAVRTPPVAQAESLTPGQFEPSKVDIQAPGGKAVGSGVPIILGKVAAKQFADLGELLTKPAEAVSIAWASGQDNPKAPENALKIEEAYKNFFAPVREAYKLTPEQEQTIKDMGLKGDALVFATAFAAQLPMYIGIPGGAGKLVTAMVKKFGESALTESLSTIIKIAGGNVSKPGKEIEDAVGAGATPVKIGETPAAAPQPNIYAPTIDHAFDAKVQHFIKIGKTPEEAKTLTKAFFDKLTPEENQVELSALEEAHTDPLTSLMNRQGAKARGYVDEKDKMINDDKEMAMIDIDNFKYGVNEPYGHRAGDDVLQDLGETLKERLGSLAHVIRYGGEEIAIKPLKPNTKDDILKIVEDVRKEFSARKFKSESGEEFGGVSFSTGWGKGFKNADEQLNQAKLGGKGQTITEGRTYGARIQPTVSREQEIRRRASDKQAALSQGNGGEKGQEPTEIAPGSETPPQQEVAPQPSAVTSVAEPEPTVPTTQEPPTVPPKGAEAPPEQPSAPPAAPSKEPPPEAAGEPTVPPPEPKPPVEPAPAEAPAKKGLGEAGAVDVSGIKEYLDKTAEQVKYSGDLAEDHYLIKGKGDADDILTKEQMKKTKASLKDQEAIYNWVENHNEPLTPEQKNIYEQERAPVKKAIDEEREYQKSMGIPLKDIGDAENYTPRYVKDRGGYLDNILSGSKGVLSGGLLRKTTGSMKHRIMLKATNELGEEHVVSVKKGRVTAWDEDKGTDLGNLNIKTNEQLLDKELEPLETKKNRLESELKILSQRKGADIRKEHIQNELEGIQKQIDDIHEGYNPAELNGKTFVDKNGQQWKLSQATTKEIEKNTSVKYHKTIIFNELHNLNRLRKVSRAVKYLENLKTNPQFKKFAVDLQKNAIPEGYKETQLPQLHGFAFPEKVTNTLDTFYKRASNGLISPETLYGSINKVMRNAIFFNMFMHTPNILVHWAVNRGLSSLAIPSRYVDLIKTSRQAFEDVLTMNENYLKVIENGGGSFFARQMNKDFEKGIIKYMGEELEAKPLLAGAVGKALGYTNPKNLIKAIYDWSGKVTWFTQDFCERQAVYEEMLHGKTMRQAVLDVGKHIPNYRIPAEIMNSTSLARLMKTEHGVTMFGAYHYGALRSYGEMIKSIVGKTPIKEKAEAFDKLSMMALIGFFVYPQMDKLAKFATGNKNAKFRRAGAITFPYKTQQFLKQNFAGLKPSEIGQKLVTGNIDFADYLQSVMTPSVGLQVGTEILSGRDWRTGAKVTPGEVALRSISPLGYGEKIAKGKLTPKNFALSFIGISSPKVDIDSMSPTEYNAYKMAMSHIPQKERTKEQIKASTDKAEIVKKFQETDNVNILSQAVKDKKITKAERTSILKKKTQTPLEQYASRLSYSEIKSLIDHASPEEKKQLENIPSFYIKEKMEKLSKLKPTDKGREAISAQIKKHIQEEAQKVQKMPPGEEKKAAVRTVQSFISKYKQAMRGVFEDDKAEEEKAKTFSIRNQPEETADEN